MSFNVQDLPDNGTEMQRSFRYNLHDIPNYRANLDINLIDNYILKNDKANKKRSVTIGDPKPTYLSMPSSDQSYKFDLTKDYEPSVEWAISPAVKIDDLFEYFKLSGIDPFENNFVTYRGVLTDLMVTPYSSRTTWHLGVSKFKGTIFICPYPDNSHDDYDQRNLMSFGGHRFEYYITSEEPNEMKSIPFSTTKEEYSSVFKSRLQSYGNTDIKILYAAEMDCLDSGKTDNSKGENFVEIKTTKKIVHPRQITSFERFKLIKWWAQSYLVNIKKIICGYKSDDHQVDSMEVFKVDFIPERCANYWSKQKSINFLYDFLRYIDHVLKNEDNPNIVYYFTNTPQKVDCYKILLDSKFRVIPEWFIRQHEKK